MKRLALCGLILTAAAAARGADFTDDFSSLDPVWVPDRYAPAGFNSTWFDGDYRLAITISPQDSAANRPAAYSSAFYNTQGRQRAADVTGAWWFLTAQTYVDADALSGNGLRRTDLWASAGLNNEINPDYFIIGYYHFDPNDPLNPNSPNITSGWRIYNDSIGNWVYLPSPLTMGWHGVGIFYDQASNQTIYTLDGTAVYVMTPGGDNPSYLRTADVQAYNFGQTPGYTVYWDNVQVLSPPVLVPEPTSWSFALMGLIACVLLQRSRNQGK